MLRMARPTRRNSSSFHQFRKRVPADLRGRVTGTKLVVEFPASGADPAVVVNATVGLNEVTFSLRTRDPAAQKLVRASPPPPLKTSSRTFAEPDRWT